MEDKSWIKLYRKIKEKGWYQNSKYVHLWVHILFRANHEEKEFMFNGSIHKTKRGEFITGRKALSSETGIAESTIEDILKLFENEGQIQQQKNNKFRLITVLNYEKFQDKQQPANNQPTSSQQPADTNKNLRIKELKNNTERHIDFLLNIPEEVIKDFSKEFNVYEQGIRGKGKDLYNYCKAKGKLYKDYKAFLRNAVKKDFGLRPIEAPKPWEIHHEVDRGGLQKLQEMKKGLNFSIKK